MITIEERFNQFVRDPGRREALAAILADPTFVEAKDIVDELMEPKIGTQADAAPAMAAAYYQQVAGANYFIKKLKELTREPKSPKQLTIKKLAKTEDDLPKQ